VTVARPDLMPPRRGPVPLLRDGLLVARRNLRHIPRVPELLTGVTIQPIMFVLLFAFVFGAAIEIPGGGSYREYLMAGIFAQTMAFGAATTAVGLAEDKSKGLADRFRSLPMTRSAVVLGRTLSDLVLNTLALAVMAVCGLLIGWSVDDLPRAAAAFGLLALFGLAMSWVGAFVGLTVRSTESAQTFGFIALFPIVFLSNVFVPVQGMPAALRVFAEWNPISAVSAACRDLFGNPDPFAAQASLPAQHPVLMTIAWSIVLVAVFAPLAVRRFLRTSSR
jgi:ABC-2 type transport system permease protein